MFANYNAATRFNNTTKDDCGTITNNDPLVPKSSQVLASSKARLGLLGEKIKFKPMVSSVMQRAVSSGQEVLVYLIG